MDIVTTVVVLVALVALVAAVLVVSRAGARRHPEDGSTHSFGPTATADRPAGPGAEAMDVEGPGAQGPGDLRPPR